MCIRDRRRVHGLEQKKNQFFQQMLKNKEIVLGFANKITESNTFQNTFFQSKLGGLPQWLNPLHQLNPKCSICNESMHFLLQVYAPLEMKYSYHRILYVFTCLSSQCLNQQHSIRIFRQQLPEENQFYEKKEQENYQLIEKYGEYVNKLNEIKICLPEYEIETDFSDIKKTNQLLNKFEKNKNNKETEEEWEDIDDEDNQEDYHHENKLYQMYQKNSANLPSDQTNEEESKIEIDQLYNEFKKEEDSSFSLYQKIIELDPEQILRYIRDSLAEPLWFTNKNQ
eukprot:TRINITY_DN4327_c0_g1_i1.p1 TRINITY_DN4327_c0_g1~~TRINITY_DN4327_c0_g1_i1.p1  ORF type:complete len:282 (+),score=58.70 TRINITY_DN4327_c0_g1_i1:117-962(+)